MRMAERRSHKRKNSSHQQLGETRFFLHTSEQHPDWDFRPVLIRTPEAC